MYSRSDKERIRITGLTGLAVIAGRKLFTQIARLKILIRVLGNASIDLFSSSIFADTKPKTTSDIKTSEYPVQLFQKEGPWAVFICIFCLMMLANLLIKKYVKLGQMLEVMERKYQRRILKEPEPKRSQNTQNGYKAIAMENKQNTLLNWLLWVKESFGDERIQVKNKSIPLDNWCLKKHLF